MSPQHRTYVEDARAIYRGCIVVLAVVFGNMRRRRRWTPTSQLRMAGTNRELILKSHQRMQRPKARTLVVSCLAECLGIHSFMRDMEAHNRCVS